MSTETLQYDPEYARHLVHLYLDNEYDLYQQKIAAFERGGCTTDLVMVMWRAASRVSYREGEGTFRGLRSNTPLMLSITAELYQEYLDGEWR